MSNVIKGTSPITGTAQGSWMRGLSAYDIAVSQGFRGTIKQWLDSLKAVSPTIGEITEVDNGVSFTITDGEGEHQVFLRNGLDITIESTEVTEDGETIITFSDSTQITIPKGETGPQGTSGREITLMCDIEGIIYWRYLDEMNWQQLIDLGSLASRKFSQELEKHPLISIVDELPAPEDAIEGVIYILREEV